GVVEHDITFQGSGFTLGAKPGQTATADFTFNSAGVFDFFCSIPGHKDAGMKGTLTVVDPSAVESAPASAHDMASMSSAAGANAASAPDIQPLPANLTSLPAPQMAPP